MIGCAPGKSCCEECQRSGLSGVESVVYDAFPSVTEVLRNYIETETRAGRPWYIAPDLNSDMIHQNGFGFFAEIGAALVSTASKIGTVAKATVSKTSGFTTAAGKILNPLATIAASSASLNAKAKAAYAASAPGQNVAATASASDIAAAIAPQVAAQLQSQGISLPPGVQQSAISASLLDAFGVSNRPYVIAGLAGLVLLLLLRKR